MEQVEQVVPPRVGLREVPVWGWAFLALLAALVYAVAFDQGALLHHLIGDIAEKKNFLHELFHDGRHLLGFPCH